MELRLHGSQINLAVRDKPPTPPAIQYPPPAAVVASSSPSPPSLYSRLLSAGPPSSAQRPPHRLRPGSAAAALADRNRLAAPRPSASSFINDPPHRRRVRPVSADNAANVVAGSADSNGIGAFPTGTSSSNILNFLLAEPIPKRTPAWNNRNEPQPNRPPSRSMSNRNIDEVQNDESSVEEDIATDISSDEEQEASGSPRETVGKPQHFTVPPSRPLFSQQQSPAKAAGTKKFVTFSKDTDMVAMARPPSAGPAVESGESAAVKPDLPGRVSFSSADVFELDFSDDENANQITRSFNPNERLSNVVSFSGSELNNKNAETSTPKSDKNEIVKSSIVQPQEAITAKECNLPKPCCPLSCTQLATNSVHNLDSAANTTPLKIPNATHAADDETDHIIAEYKREIAKLNRDHEQNIGKISHDPSKYLCDSNTAAPKSDNNMANKDNMTQLVQKLNIQSSDCSEKCTNTGNELQASKISIDSSTVVINNYLKTTKQPVLPKNHPPKSTNTIAQNATTRAKTSLNGGGKARIGSTTAVRQSARCTKTDCDESRLNEYQLDKVESWMSVHEFVDKKETGAVANVIARRDTPNSKTDDEGMFSYDDQHDDDSSTYEEIASVLKEIDEQKVKDGRHLLKTTYMKNGVDDNEDDDDVNDGAESPDKMREILAYLDGVESSCVQTMQDTYGGNIPDSFRSDIEFAVEPDIIGDMPKIGDLITLPNQQLARRVIALSLRANELTSAIQLSREHMASVRKEKVRTVRAEKQTAATRLTDQKRHFEGVVQRHQAFIEQLLKDKTALSDKITTLNRRIESQNQAWQHKLDTEMVRIKETTMAGEKIRRERWVRENTKKIKELTVKGLEQEINQMTGTHQNQIAELRRQHQRDILQAVEEERAKHEQLESGIRETYALDREATIEKERKAIRERFERQISSEQQDFEQQKARMVADFASEKKRLQDAAHSAETAAERRQEAMAEERTIAVAAVKAEYNTRLAGAERKHQTELKSLQEQYEADFKIWRREHETAAKLRETERETAIRREAHLERDRQIDAIVARLDTENLKNQQEFEQKLSRLHGKHAHEQKQLELAESSMRDKYTECRAKLAESEAAREIAQTTAKQHEIQLQHTQQLYDAQLAEKEHLKEAARHEVQLELVALRKDRDSEIERIYARVQQAVERKDATVELLHKENAALKERCVKLEAVVRQQRQDYFVK